MAFMADIGAQDVHNSDAFRRYGKWAVTLKPLLYQKARINRDYGTKTLKSKSLYSANIGLEYIFTPTNTFSLRTGLNVGFEPGYHISYYMADMDIYPQYKGRHSTFYGYTIESLSVPIMIEYKRRVGRNVFFNFSPGLRIMYYPPGGTVFSVTYHSKDRKNTRTVFDMSLLSPDVDFHYSVALSSGLYFLFEKLLLKVNLVYNNKFRYQLRGRYRFANMFVTPPSGGSYELSGDYIGLDLSFRLKKQ